MVRLDGREADGALMRGRRAVTICPPGVGVNNFAPARRMRGRAPLPSLLVVDTPTRPAYRSPRSSPLNLNGFNLLTKGNIMLKKLTRKLITLSVLCVALAVVSFTPASSSTRRMLICFDMPEGCVGNQKYCCDRQSGDCYCV